MEQLGQFEFQHAAARQFLRPVSANNLTGNARDKDVAFGLRICQQNRIVSLGAGQNRQRAAGSFSVVAERIEFALFRGGGNVAGVPREGGRGGWLFICACALSLTSIPSNRETAIVAAVSNRQVIGGRFLGLIFRAFSPLFRFYCAERKISAPGNKPMRVPRGKARVFGRFWPKFGFWRGR